MDIINELKKLSLEDSNTKQILKNMNDEMEKKLHILRVFEFAHAIDSLAKDKKYQKYLKIIKVFNNTYQSRPLMMIFLDHHDNDVLRYSINVMQELVELKPLIENIVKSKIEYTNCDIPVGKFISIDFKKGMKDEILKYFLSDELKTILDYSQMQIDLDEKSNTQKKLKI